VKQNIKMCRS